MNHRVTDGANYTSVDSSKAKRVNSNGVILMRFVEVPEPTPAGAPITRIYAATIEQAQAKADQALKSRGYQCSITKDINKKRDAAVQRHRMKKDPRLQIGKTFGKWTVIAEPESVMRGGSKPVKMVTCKCSCGHVESKAAGSLVSKKSTMCWDCSVELQRDKRRLAANAKELNNVVNEFCGGVA